MMLQRRLQPARMGQLMVLVLQEVPSSLLLHGEKSSSMEQRVQPPPQLIWGRMLAWTSPLSPGFGRRVQRAAVLRDMHGQHPLAQRHRLHLDGLWDPRGAR